MEDEGRPETGALFTCRGCHGCERDQQLQPQRGRCGGRCHEYDERKRKQHNRKQRGREVHLIAAKSTLDREICHSRRTPFIRALPTL